MEYSPTVDRWTIFPEDGHLDFNPKVYQELGLEVFRKMSVTNSVIIIYTMRAKGINIKM